MYSTSVNCKVKLFCHFPSMPCMQTQSNGICKAKNILSAQFKLTGIKLIVTSFLFQQLIMTATFDDLAMI